MIGDLVQLTRGTVVRSHSASVFCTTLEALVSLRMTSKRLNGIARLLK